MSTLGSELFTLGEGASLWGLGRWGNVEDSTELGDGINELWALEDWLFDFWLLESRSKAIKVHVELVHVGYCGGLASHGVEVHRITDANSTIHKAPVVSVVVHCRSNIESFHTVVGPGRVLLGPGEDHDLAPHGRHWGLVEVKLPMNLGIG